MTPSKKTAIKKITSRNAGACQAIEILLNKKAQDIRIFDLRSLTQLFDFGIIATGLSTTQVAVLKRSIERGLRECGIRPLGVEGSPESGWILLDYVDFVIHVFLPEKRQYYHLDQLWGDQPSEDVKDEEED